MLLCDIAYCFPYEVEIKLSLLLGYSGVNRDIPVRLGQYAEKLGFDSVWTAEAHGSDAITPLAYLAIVTERINQLYRAWESSGATGLIMWAPRLNLFFSTHRSTALIICLAHLQELDHLFRNLFLQQPIKFAGNDSAIRAQLRGNPSGQKVLF